MKMARDNVQSHGLSIVVKDASSDNEEELARVREAYLCDTKGPIPRLQHANLVQGKESKSAFQ